MRIRNLETGKSWRPEDLIMDLAGDVGAGKITEEEFLEKIVFAFPAMSSMWYVDLCNDYIDWSPPPEFLKKVRKLNGAVYAEDLAKPSQ